MNPECFVLESSKAETVKRQTGKCDDNFVCLYEYSEWEITIAFATSSYFNTNT